MTEVQILYHKKCQDFEELQAEHKEFVGSLVFLFFLKT